MPLARHALVLALVGGAILAPGAAPAQQAGVNASRCSVVVMGNVSASRINVQGCLNGVTSAELRRVIEQAMARSQPDQAELVKVATKLGVREGWVRQILMPLLHLESIPDDQLEQRVAEGIGRLNEIVDKTAPAAGDDAEVLALKAKVKAAIDAEHPDEADQALSALEQIEERALAGRMAERASAAAQRGDLAVVQARYGDAAGHFAKAAQFSLDAAARYDFRWKEADALYRHGVAQGDNVALMASIERWNALLRETDRGHNSGSWAALQSNLGNALGSLGEREAGDTSLKLAVEAYRNALLEQRRERVPLDWASTQNNLGTTLFELGQREVGDTSIKLAVEAYRNALLEFRRERVPLEWAMTQNNLGNALAGLGEREAGDTGLKLAVETYRNALLEWRRERAPLDWATAQSNLGVALRALGEREPGDASLKLAVEALRNALLERRRERVPLAWATTQNNLGTALLVLGARESRNSSLTLAVEAYRNALLEFRRERVPLDWASTQNNLGIALRVLGEREARDTNLKLAIEANSSALLEYRRERVPRLWGLTSMDLAAAEATLARRNRDPALLAAARGHYADGLPYHADGTPNAGFRRDVARRIAEAEKALAKP